MNLDPMSEKFYGWTPYKYSLNNPILFMDPDGKCETCLKALKKYYGGVWNGFKNTFVSAGSAIKQAVADPIGTVKAAASDHLDRITNPSRLINDTVDAISTVNPTVAVVNDVVTAATSNDPISAVGNQVGERLANQSMELAGEGIGIGISKTAKVLKNVLRSSDWDVLPTNLKFDEGAHNLAKEIDGVPQSRFRNSNREFDAISDKYIGQHKPALGNNFGKSFKNQARATFEAAKSTGREVFYRFDAKPGQKVIDKLNQYFKEYGVNITIKY